MSESLLADEPLVEVVDLPDFPVDFLLVVALPEYTLVSEFLVVPEELDVVEKDSLDDGESAVFPDDEFEVVEEGAPLKSYCFSAPLFVDFRNEFDDLDFLLALPIAPWPELKNRPEMPVGSGTLRCLVYM